MIYYLRIITWSLHTASSYDAYDTRCTWMDTGGELTTQTRTHFGRDHSVEAD